MNNINYLPILKERYSSWKELENKIGLLSTTKEIGDAFEQFIFAYFIIKQQQYLISEIYMSKDIPEKYLEEYKIAHKRSSDCGVDGLIIRTDGLAVAYQCKFRSERKKPSYEELAKFWSDSRYCDFCCTVANCYDVSDLSEKHEKNLSILVQEFDSLEESFFERLYELTNSDNGGLSSAKQFYEPYDYQKRIINDVVDGFSIEDRGKIIAACGTGKTLTALWIVEAMKNVHTVLFLAPSITLVKQTLEAWSDQSHTGFSYLCVCSDNTVNSDLESDESDIKVSDLGIPVTTDKNEIAAFLLKPTAGKKYVFSTYQSADKISAGQTLAKTTFDLTICDEAHRTAGLRSNFSMALEDKYIRSKKRLFMTATERMVRPMLLRKARNNGEVIFSMDDESVYGPLFSRYNFGDAIKDKTISDYKIIVAGVKESEVYNYIAENTTLKLTDLDNEEKITTAEALYAKLLLSKTMKEFPIHKVISFHSSIQRSTDFITNNEQSVSLNNIIRQFNTHIETEDLYIDNISCKIPANRRASILSTFKSSEYGIISNAKCLTEGVDVPIIDSVYFVDQKKSLVDIVQACGRALRTKRGTSKTAYFIIPILIPESEVATDILYSEKFDAVYNIIQALRDQDSRLVDWINELNRKYVTGVGGRAGVGGIDAGAGSEIPIDIRIEGIDLDQFSEELFVKIATVNASRRIDQGGERGSRTAGQTRLFKPMVDMTLNTLMNNLVLPTLNSYKLTKKRILPASDIRFNHNNISHTIKVGLIQKEGSAEYGLTPLGEEFIKGKYSKDVLLRRQLLRYSCSVEDANIVRVLFPYRAFFEILKILPGKKKISFLEFAFCIYTMKDSSRISIIKAAQDIQYLRINYPYLAQTNVSNRTSILEELNEHFNSTLSEGDIWGARATTVKNQYMYFRDHLSIYKEVVEIKDGEICIKRDTDAIIERLLVPDKEMEQLPRASLLARYSEALLFLIFFTLTN